jgi:nucleotide-binding universal stress UspA family protein
MAMEDIKRIIVPVDNTEDSKKAVEKAAYLAKILGVELKVITVNDTHQFMSSVVLEDKLKKESELFLDSFKEIAAKLGVEINTELITGKPAEEIIKFARDDDLIIIAHHDRTKGFDKVIEKSVSKEVVQRAPCSVFVIK